MSYTVALISLEFLVREMPILMKKIIMGKSVENNV